MEDSKHSNSTGSQKITTALDAGYFKAIITTVSLALHKHLLEDKSLEKDAVPCEDALNFDEETYLKEKMDLFDEEKLALLRELPTVEQISAFITSLHECVQVRPETLIVSQLYINRIISTTEIRLNATNWRPLVICGILIAHKVCDENLISNDKIAFIYPFFTVEEIDKLEQKFLELIEYQINVKAGTYVKYYFEVEALSKGNVKSVEVLVIN